ncbi:hypothetical protein K523DRAFT_419338 [Schizophyllum commune Tattone D]|nr:hypothetical protein K523DRAFT_419338 [Schizophyllum commune Tattone D]
MPTAALSNALSSIARYPSFTQAQKLKACRDMEKVLRQPRVFHDLARDPEALVKEYKIRLPVNMLLLPGPFRDAHLTLAHTNLLLIMAADSPAILDIIIRAYPNTWRWIVFFHPRFGNTIRNAMEDVQIVERAITSLGVFPQGREVIRSMPDGFYLLFDIWINLFDYAPPSAVTKEWPALEECDRSLGTVIRSFFDDIPGKAADKRNNLDAIMLMEAALATTDGNIRRLHRKALNDRLRPFIARKPIPIEELGLALSSTQVILTSLNINRTAPLPRDVVYTIVDAWKAISTGPYTSLVRKASEHFATILVEFYERASDVRQLAWAVRAGAVPLILQLVRTRGPRDGINGPFLLQYLRAQMIYRNFMRVLHRYAGPTMILRKDDPVPVRAFITEYQENVRRLDQVKAWMQSLSCQNPECPSPGSPSTLRKCADCRSVYYCSEECQAQHWKAEHHRSCGTSDSKPEYFTPADFQYTTAITKKYLIKMRNTILAQVASVQNAPSFDPATEAVMVVLDFASLNLGGSLETPQEPGIGATAIAANFRKFNERERKVGFLQVVLPDGSGVEEGVGIYMRTAPFDFERFKEGEMPPFLLYTPTV